MRHRKDQLILNLDVKPQDAGCSIPLGAKIIARATLTESGTQGVVVQLIAGDYLFLSPSRLEQIDGRTMAALLGKSGRPKLDGSPKRVAIYLDEASVELAKDLGSGNISKGVRNALSFAKKSK